MSNNLTSDNPYLSRPTTRARARQCSCCTDLPDAVAGYVRDSLAENTRRAYLSDLAAFRGVGRLDPASAETIAAYLAAHADSLSVATLVRRLASISKAHQARGLSNPTRSELVRATMRGIKRTRGCAQREAKPLLRDDLLLVLDAMGDGLKDIRDRALLLIGFAGALRRSELVGARRGGYRARPAGYRAAPTAFEDRPGWPGPQDRHSIRADPLVPRRRARRLADSLRHCGGRDIPAGRPSRPRARCPPIRAKPYRLSSGSGLRLPGSIRHGTRGTRSGRD